MEHTPNDTAGTVIERIKQAGVSMKPRWHFVLHGALGLLGIALAAGVAVYLVSLFLFLIRLSGAGAAPMFGLHGTLLFLTTAPWFLILIALMCIVLIEMLVRTHAATYRKPALYVLLAIIGLITVSSVLVAQVGIHDRILRMDERGVVGGWYREAGMPPRGAGVHAGSVAALTDTGFALESRRNERLIIRVSSSTQFVDGRPVVVNDAVVVIGNRVGDTVMAEGVVHDTNGPRLVRPLPR